MTLEWRTRKVSDDEGKGHVNRSGRSHYVTKEDLMSVILSVCLHSEYSELLERNSAQQPGSFGSNNGVTKSASMIMLNLNNARAWACSR
jgi:hypothetical protein